MNKQQRAQVQDVCQILESLQSEDLMRSIKLDTAKERVETAASALRDLADEEGEKFDNLSEGLQSSSKGEALQEAQDALNDAADKLDEAAVMCEEEEFEAAPDEGDWTWFLDWTDLLQGAMDRACEV